MTTTASKPIVLVTGAGGFIGWHVCKSLLQTGCMSVRAGIRSSGSIGELGRLSLDAVVCDVTKADEVARSLDDVSYVVHCAKGGVIGLQNLLEKCRGQEIKRFIHLSSIATYKRRRGTVSEDAPIHQNGTSYSGWKAHAERIVLEYLDRGVPATILRPTVVYGPFNKNWTLGFARTLLSGGWPIAKEFCRGICNAVFVDDVVQAVRLALDSESAIGRTFNINGDERLTWNDYLDALARVLGLPSCPYRSTWTSAVLNLLPVTVWDRLLGGLVSDRSLGRFSREVYYPIDRARELLGYRPMFTLSQGMAETKHWLQELNLSSPHYA